METISFEKLRAEFWDASFIMAPYYSDCIELHHAFSFEFNERTVARAYEKLGKARSLINKIDREYTSNKQKKALDSLSKLVTDSYCRLIVFTSNLSAKREPRQHDFLF